MTELKPCPIKTEKRGHWTHGFFANYRRLYGTWESMRARCNNPHREKYKDYGARGIKVCDDWNKSAKSFCEWALKNGYKEGLQLDRIDNSKGYEPDNCRFVTPKVNSRNRRNTVYITIRGIKKSVAEWCETINISPYTVYWWIREKGIEYAEERLSKIA